MKSLQGFYWFTFTSQGSSWRAELSLILSCLLIGIAVQGGTWTSNISSVMRNHLRDLEFEGLPAQIKTWDLGLPETELDAIPCSSSLSYVALPTVVPNIFNITCPESFEIRWINNRMVRVSQQQQQQKIAIALNILLPETFDMARISGSRKGKLTKIWIFSS